ncbi:MAG: hypothetical protein HN929_03305 [Chloroflexi bacterium]|jgi:hypothetical protein|nr:hypothetical protein [Chloroflexota bacterium]MBT7080488.1 hypothetical protein [Chloroflexota bacterium]MBT7290281.1 hypothetical protein [Chloroflexota bacterium]
MPPLEAWEKVLITDMGFTEDAHDPLSCDGYSQLNCIGCHEGNNETQVKDEAHEGLIHDPSDTSCDSCHEEKALSSANSLHTTLDGMKTILEARGGLLNEGSPLDTAFDNHCDSCHTSCGQCHISRPTTLGGGLVSGHTFKAVPSLVENCGSCHGARVAAEYFGNNEGIPGDVHWTQSGMTCYDCHGDDEMHGVGQDANDRYHQPATPSCIDCHEDIETSNTQHQLHYDNLACQVCHSVEYKNCYNCHVDVSDNGTPYFTTDDSQMLFKIGLNPIQSDTIPYEYVVLRHIPATTDMFESYGSNLLPNFDNVPTWKYATPHNIQRLTPQNETCASCHDNESIFLNANDIPLGEQGANENVIVPELP